MTEVKELPKLWEASEIKADQNVIRESLLDLDGRIHMNAFMCLAHCEKHGDTGPMKRLLVDIIDKKTGYRRQGLIVWMKTWGPMRLDGDNIKLTGMVNGVRQAFRLEKALETPFWTMAGAREMVPFKPVFRDDLASKLNKNVKEYRDALANTVFGPGGATPKVAGKPFFNGNQADKVEAALEKIGQDIKELESWNDPTKTIYTAQQTIARATMEAKAAEDEPAKELIEQPEI